jgi:RNA polymerase sigma-70 factor (ECF subfamily)
VQTETEFRNKLIALLPRLSRFAMTLTRSRHDADDLIQASCERALARIGQWDPNTQLDSWMFRIMQTVWFNEARARRVRERYGDELKSDSATGAVGEGLPENRLLLQRVADEINALPEDQRAMLLLVCVEGLSYKEVAEVLQIPIGTVASRMARARLTLMSRIGADQGGAEAGENVVRMVHK